MSDFIKYQHIEKLSNYDETEGILNGNVFIQPKIDGSNCCIWLEDNEIHYGSRNRELTLDNDYAGFMKYIYDNKEKYLKLLNKYPNRIIYGEWLIPHTIKTYVKTAWNKFYVFDIVSKDEFYTDYGEIEKVCKELEIDYVPVLSKLRFPNVDDITNLMNQNHFLMPDKTFIGEGIVIKNLDFVNRYGRRVWAKIITSDFKHKKYVKDEKEKYSLEQEIVEKYLTLDIVEKVYANIMIDFKYWNKKLIPKLLGTVYHDFVLECIWQVVKDFKKPIVNFRNLE